MSSTRISSRGDLLKVLKAEAIQPIELTVDKMIEYFSAQLQFVTPAGLAQLYYRADRIPSTSTRALAKSSFSGLVVGDIFPATGGRADLLRAFRGAKPLLVKIPFDQTEAAAELHAYNQLGAVFWVLSVSYLYFGTCRQT